MYEKGIDVRIDDTRAVDYYTRACSLGELASCERLGHCYEEGRGVRKDLLKARELYGKFCRRVKGLGCVSEGSLFERGLGVEKDVARAAELYRAACQEYMYAGCYPLARLVEQKLVPLKASDGSLDVLYAKGCAHRDLEACRQSHGIKYGLHYQLFPAGARRVTPAHGPH